MEAPAAPFRLTSFVWESQPGRYVLTVIAHGTAKLAQGREATWTTPEEFPLGYDDGQTQSARMNLLAPFKPRADVVVVGKAYAPPGGDADRLIARVRLGDFSKAVSITGDRLWMKNEAGRWGSSPPRPFSQMLLAPERSIRSAENPVGLDPAGLPVEGRLSLPNLEPVAGSYSAIIGPVPPLAPSRRNLLNPQGVAWVSALEMGRAPGPVADAMSFAFFNVAPADQQLAEITPGSAIVLENLNPAHSMFTSRLPTTIPRVRGSDPASGRPIEPQLRCDTVWIDGDREMAWLVFRGTVDLLRPDLLVTLSVDVERWQAPAVIAPMATQTMLHTQTGAQSPSAPLPFAAQRGPSFGSYAQPEGPAAYSYQQPPHTARMRDESTADLPEKGSYPPPPGPKRSITAEILLEAQTQAQPQALPFGHEWDSATTGDLEITASGAGSLARQDTAELTPIHATEPPPPPSMAIALPFADGLGPGLGQAEPTPPQKNLKPLGSPGPIPEISETKQPELPPGLIDEAAARGPISVRGPSALSDFVDLRSEAEKAPPSAATQPAMPIPKLEAPKSEAPPAVTPPPTVPKPEAPKSEAPPAVTPPPMIPKLDLPKAETPPAVTPPPTIPKLDPAKSEAPPAVTPPPMLKSVSSLPPAPPQLSKPMLRVPPPPAVPSSLLKLPPVPPAPPAAPLEPVAPVRAADTVPGATVLDEATNAAEVPSEISEPARADAAPMPPPRAAPADPAAEVVASDPDPTPLPDPPPAATRDSLTLEEAAAVRAQLSQKGAEKAAVLERFSLGDSDWTRIERDHLKAIDEGVRAGDSALLDRYDDAFLASQDEIRGAIDGTGYAKIQVARERGQLGAVLEELKVARGDLLRIDRVWRRRLATDRELAERVEDEMERLRDEQP